MTLKNNRAPLLCCFQLCAWFHCHMWFQTGVRVRKRLSWVLTSVTLTFDLWPWPFAWTSLLTMVITPENIMMIQWWENGEKGVTDRQTDRRTDGRTDGLNQSYSCLVAARNAYDRVVFLLFHKSHDASVLYPKIHHFITEICTSAHFSYIAVHCGIVAWCIVRFVRCVYIRACKGLVWWCLYVQWLPIMTSSDGNIFRVNAENVSIWWRHHGICRSSPEIWAMSVPLAPLITL